jgi:uncharacterized protein (DUF58 family)
MNSDKAHRPPDMTSEALPLVVDRSRVRIRPTRHGVVFLVMLAGMLMGSVNYGNNLGFLLTFLLAGMGFVSVLHTHRNLAGLTLVSCHSDAVFAGQTAIFRITVGRDAVRRCGVHFQFSKQPEPGADDAVLDGQARTVAVGSTTRNRGLHRPGLLWVVSEHPFGMFRAWCRLRPDVHCLVYPRPLEGAVPPVQNPSTAAGEGTVGGPGMDEFQGLRAYQPGDPLQHISWKASARGQGLYTKSFAGRRTASATIDWDACTEPNPERRLSVLCHAVLRFHRHRRAFGLKLPGASVEPGRGELHKARCLEALARFTAA